MMEMDGKKSCLPCPQNEVESKVSCLTCIVIHLCRAQYAEHSPNMSDTSADTIFHNWQQ